MTLITLAFAPSMEDAILQGKKCCTTRREKHGEVGDIFLVKDRLYRICHIHSCLLYSARDTYYDADGFVFPGDFQEFWKQNVGPFSPGRIVYLHFFAYLSDICPDFNQGRRSCVSSACLASEVCDHGD